MKLRPIWTPDDAVKLRNAMATHPAYIHLQQRAAEAEPESERLADVIDINTRRRLA